MYKKIMFSIIAFLIFGIFISYILYGGESNDFSEKNSSSMSINMPITEKTETGNSIKDYYCIKIVDDKLTVIKNDEKTPEMIFDISVKMLPEYDRQKLKDGVYVYSYDELLKKIEDYTS